MNERRRRFLEAYIVEPNATQAAITAGYSPKTAYAQGQRLLKNAEVATALATARERLRVRSDVEAGDVIRELTRIGFAKLTDVASWGPDGLELVASDELSPDVAAAVKEVTVTRTVTRGKDEYEVERVVTKITMHDKKGALDSLMRRLGLFDADQRAGGDTHYHLPAGLSLDDLRALAYDRRVVDAQFEEGEHA
ncbi:MAG TPA: terminase small subunit [Gemmatimonadales bacterium]